MIASLRKEKGMTQLDLAEKMGVTDKAVSKWERDLSCPDVNTIPKLAELFGISVDELMQIKSEVQEEKKISGKHAPLTQSRANSPTVRCQTRNFIRIWKDYRKNWTYSRECTTVFRVI